MYWRQGQGSGIVTGLPDGRPRNRGSTPSRVKRFPLLQSSQTHSGAQTATQQFFPRDKNEGRVADELYLVPKLRVSGVIPPYPPTSSWVSQDNLHYLTFIIVNFSLIIRILCGNYACARQP